MESGEHERQLIDRLYQAQRLTASPLCCEPGHKVIKRNQKEDCWAWEGALGKDMNALIITHCPFCGQELDSIKKRADEL